METEFTNLIFTAIETNPERFKKLLEKIGFTKQENSKLKLTTKEMCSQLGINYNSWLQSKVKNDPRILKMCDTSSGRSRLYHSKDLPTIEKIWKERKD